MSKQLLCLAAGLTLVVAGCNEGGLPALLGRDLAVPVDLAPPLDLQRPPDLARPDLSMPDLAQVDRGPCTGPLFVPRLPSLTLPGGFKGSSWVASADLDGDGHADAVVGGNAISRGVYVAFGAGDGTLGAARRVADTQAYGLAFADFDRDGRVDIAFTDLESVLIVRNLGQRAFGQPTVVAPPKTHVGGIAAGDLDEDGKPDLLIGGGALFTTLVPGRGNGTFGDERQIGGTVDYSTFLFADLDRDGHLDHLGGKFQGTGLTFELGNGTGWLGHGFDVPDPAIPDAIYAGQAVDLDGDGLLDLVMPPQTQDFLSVARNLGKGQFDAPRHFKLDTGKGSIRGVAVAQVDGQRGPDLVAAVSSGGRVQVLTSLGGAAFAPPVTVMDVGDCVDAYHLAVADLNEDGQLDLVCGLDGSGKVPVLLGACH